MNRNSAVALALGLFAPVLFAADWPQWQGTDRNNISKDKGLLQKWPQGGPKLLWTFKDTGHGYSAPAIVGDRLYVLGARGDTEYLLSLDVKSGMELWKVKLGKTYTFNGNQWGVGPAQRPRWPAISSTLWAAPAISCAPPPPARRSGARVCRMT